MWHLGHVSTFKVGLVVLTWTTVNFWTEVWTKTLSPSFFKTKVSTTIRNEPYGAKNKGVKPLGAKTYLSLLIYCYN
jgi:hypothetical protein